MKAPALFSELTRKDLASMGASGGGSDKRDSKKEERRKKAASGGSKGGGGGGGGGGSSGGGGGGGRGGRESKTQKVLFYRSIKSVPSESISEKKTAVKIHVWLNKQGPVVRSTVSANPG